MPTALSRLEPTWYILESEREDKNATEFSLKPLSGLEFMRVAELVKVNREGGVELNAVACDEILRWGLKGWRRFFDEEGAPVPFSKTFDTNISRLPNSAITELAWEVLLRSQLSEAAKKK